MKRRFAKGFSTTFAMLGLGVAGTAAADGIACADLAAAAIPDTRITLAQLNPASADPVAPEHCEIIGFINDRTGVDGESYAIGFHLRLPVDWNGRFFFQGGGGTDGFLGTALGDIGPGQTDNAINRGFAVVSTDAGHQAEDIFGISGSFFGLDPQARIDYGYNAIDEVSRTAKTIIALHYGADPQFSYFMGCSNGGRQGMVASQRFPEIFDGIVAGNPGFNLPKAAVAQAWDSQAFARAATETDIFGNPYLPTSFSFADLGLVAGAVTAQCDKLDGLEDQIIDNLPACTFDPAVLECAGEKNESCLSSEQVTALKDVFGGARNSLGEEIYSDWPYDTSIGTVDWRVWKLGFPAAEGEAKINNSLNVTLGGSSLPYIFMSPPDDIAGTGQENGGYIFDFDFDGDAPRIFATSGIFTESSMDFMSAASTDLRAFSRRGGKLIVYHGNSDPVFSVNDTIDWYRSLLRNSGGYAFKFVRLFQVPGMAHCSGGNATNEFEALTAIVDWVEHGRAPRQIIAGAAGNTPWPDRERPLCPYPTQTRYLGEGDIDDAANFTCVLPNCFDVKAGKFFKHHF